MKTLNFLLVLALFTSLYACGGKSEAGDATQNDTAVLGDTDTAKGETSADATPVDTAGKDITPFDAGTDTAKDTFSGDTNQPDTPQKDGIVFDQGQKDTTPTLLDCKGYYFCQSECPQGTAGQDCVNECESNTSQTGIDNWGEFLTCLQNNCAGITDDTEFSKCLEENCLDSYFKCFSGDQYPTCFDLTACTGACSQVEDNPATKDVDEHQECVNDCFSNASYDANWDFEKWRQCIIKECPCLVEQENPDAACNTCYQTAMTGTCAAQTAKCFKSGTKKCGETFTCLMACQDDACVQACYDNASLNGQIKVGNLIDCMFNACPVCEDANKQEECQTCLDATLQDAAKCKTQYDTCVNDA
jgi:hypothetical protein